MTLDEAIAKYLEIYLQDKIMFPLIDQTIEWLKELKKYREARDHSNLYIKNDELYLLMPTKYL